MDVQEIFGYGLAIIVIAVLGLLSRKSRQAPQEEDKRT